MAASTLSVLTHPIFPQLAELLLASEIRRVEQVLGSCNFSNRQASCREKAVVSDLETGCGYCLMHFGQEVDLG